MTAFLHFTATQNITSSRKERPWTWNVTSPAKCRGQNATGSTTGQRQLTLCAATGEKMTGTFCSFTEIKMVDVTSCHVIEVERMMHVVCH